MPEPVTIDAGPRICFHPGDAWLTSPDDPTKSTGSKCFHPADDDPTAELCRSLTEIDARALAALAGR